jgi:hypothetical protein
VLGLVCSLAAADQSAIGEKAAEMVTADHSVKLTDFVGNELV